MTILKVLLLVAAALTGMALYFVVPTKALVIMFMIWSACWLAEEKSNLKSALILLYMPVCFQIFPVLFFFIAVFAIAFFGAATGLVTESSVNALSILLALSTILSGFFILDLLLILRHRKKERLTSPGFPVCLGLAIIIRLVLSLMFYFSLLSSAEMADLDSLQGALDILMTASQTKLYFLIFYLTVYLPPLGILLSPPAEEGYETR